MPVYFISGKKDGLCEADDVVVSHTKKIPSFKKKYTIDRFVHGDFINPKGRKAEELMGYIIEALGGGGDDGDTGSEILRQLFARFDRNSNELLSRRELKNLHSEVCSACGDTSAQIKREASKLLADFDTNGDGQLSLEEFTKLSNSEYGTLTPAHLLFKKYDVRAEYNKLAVRELS